MIAIKTQNMSVLPVITVLFCLMSYGSISTAASEQITIPRIEQMPNYPQPYEMRDWKKVARDYDAFVFDFQKTGKHLPLIWWDERKHDFPYKTFALPPFIGHFGSSTNQYDTITCLGAINGASLVGIDKTDQGGHNWVLMCQNYFNKNNGQNLYLNNVPGRTGQSFWYELFPSILFYRIFDYYPDTKGMAEQFIVTADRWYDASVAMGGETQPWSVPDYDHTAFDFTTMQPYDNGMWKEAGSSAAIAWIEYAAYSRTGNMKYLTGAQWGMDYLQQRKTNPYYEVLFPHGPYVAARMNAEQGKKYDVEKLVNWVFDGSNPRRWGVSTGKWGSYDCSGLASSVVTDEGEYAFIMNTFNRASTLVPMVRYDTRFARAIGKWMLNAANSARLFYANGLPKDQQTDYDWAQKYDPDFCIAYEGLRRSNDSLRRVREDYQTLAGCIKSGSIKDTYFTNEIFQIFEETVTEEDERLEHIWRTDLPEADLYTLNMVAKCGGKEGFRISYSSDPNGPFFPLFEINANHKSHHSAEFKTGTGVLYLKAEDLKRQDELHELDTLSIDDIWIIGSKTNGPLATGDAKDSGWAATNYGLYGSSFVGIFGGIIRTTNVEGILQLDCLVTDHFHAAACPTYLYYNPHTKIQSVTLVIGSERKHVYDAVGHSFLQKNVSGKVTLTIAPDSAVLAVITPATDRIEYKEQQTLVDGIVIDYQKGK